MVEVMGYPLGICQIHGPKLAVNGVPTCIKCQAKQDNAERVLVVSTTEDPGEDYFKSGKANPQVQTEKDVHTRPKQPQKIYTLQSGLQEILDILTYIPMPSSMKQYKLLVSVKQKIEAALQEG